MLLTQSAREGSAAAALVARPTPVQAELTLRGREILVGEELARHESAKRQAKRPRDDEAEGEGEGEAADDEEHRPDA